MENLSVSRNESTLFTLEEQILHHLMLQSVFLNRNGLLYGRMGIALAFFEYGKHCNNILYINFAKELKDSIFKKVNDAVPLDYATGLCGVGWGIEYMTPYKLDKRDIDICTKIDQKIMMLNISRVTDLSLETGLEGFLHYILIRIKGSEMRKTAIPFDEFYLKDLYNKIESLPKDIVSNDLKQAFHSYMDAGSLIYHPDLTLLTSDTAITDEDDILSAKLGLADGLAGKLIRIINSQQCIHS